jgi:hypothetical protein
MRISQMYKIFMAIVKLRLQVNGMKKRGVLVQKYCLSLKFKGNVQRDGTGRN